MQTIYQLVWWLLLPMALLRLRWRARALPGYTARWQQRLALLDDAIVTKLHGIRSIWVHAVSVGESVVAVSLIKQLQLLYPDVPIVVTNMTPTGSAWISDQLGDQVVNVYAPYDHAWIVEKFFRTIRPRVLLLIETEIWPNWLMQAQRGGVPVLLVNGRLSQQSATQYARFKFWSRPMFGRLSHASMQASADAERIIQLGVPATHVSVNGNIKLDVHPSPQIFDQARGLKQQIGKRPVWIAASTHAGEEAAFLALHRTLRQSVPEALLILVPRHPDRFAQVAELLTDWRWHRASVAQPIPSDAEVLLGDVMGQLLILYGAADAAVIGGSFVPVGGHNMLEAMAMGAPVLIGPQVFNFQSLTDQLLAAQALVQVQSFAELLVPLQKWLQHPSTAIPQIKHAADFMQANRGALEKTMALVQKVMPSY